MKFKLYSVIQVVALCEVEIESADKIKVDTVQPIKVNPTFYANLPAGMELTEEKVYKYADAVHKLVLTMVGKSMEEGTSAVESSPTSGDLLQ